VLAEGRSIEVAAAAGQRPVISAEQFEREKAKILSWHSSTPAAGRPTGKPRLAARPFLDQIILRIARAPASP
jgi:hypothetical protein